MDRILIFVMVCFTFMGMVLGFMIWDLAMDKPNPGNDIQIVQDVHWMIRDQDTLYTDNGTFEARGGHYFNRDNSTLIYRKDPQEKAESMTFDYYACLVVLVIGFGILGLFGGLTLNRWFESKRRF